MLYTKSSKKTKLQDGTVIHCIKPMEAVVLDDHVSGYFNHGIAINSGDVVIDIGANIGVFGFRVSQMVEKIEIHCFEPIPTIYDVLKQNAELSSNPSFHTHQIGIGAEDGSLNFTYFPNAPALSTTNPEMWDHDKTAFRKAVKGSLDNPPQSMRWTKYVPNIAVPLLASYLTKNRVEVDCKMKSLSSFLDKSRLTKIDLLKIDCEGHEWEVLKGIRDDHWPLIQSAVIEIHNREERLQNVISLFKSKDFQKIKVEKEKALQETDLVNLFAVR